MLFVWYKFVNLSAKKSLIWGGPVDPVALVGVSVGIHADALAVPAPAFPLALVGLGCGV